MRNNFESNDRDMYSDDSNPTLWQSSAACGNDIGLPDG